ncbi:hypothetical protein BDZ89DRAFT_1108563 [Hymenopellis radicata]|nr:hypothetical protein BDZ89DRAFT_1108563 [Hymenopellis radicata]
MAPDIGIKGEWGAAHKRDPHSDSGVWEEGEYQMRWSPANKGMQCGKARRRRGTTARWMTAMRTQDIVGKHQHEIRSNGVMEGRDGAQGTKLPPARAREWGVRRGKKKAAKKGFGYTRRLSGTAVMEKRD